MTRRICAVAAICWAIASATGYCSGLAERIREHRLPTYQIERETFVSLKSVLKILNSDDSWGRIDDRVFFLYGKKEVKIRVGYPDVIVSGRTEKMDFPAREVEGEVLVHLKSFERILGAAEPAGKASGEPAGRTESPPAASREPQRPAAGSPGGNLVILIDPGHGGGDSGAVGNYGLKEKYVNLDVSLRLRDYLKKKLGSRKNVKIYMSREEDIFLSLEERVQMARSLGANVFFCVHTNSSRYNRLDADGFETYFPRRKEEMEVLPSPVSAEEIEESVEKDTVLLQIVRDLNETTVIDESRILADIVQEKLAERLITPDRGAKPGNFYVLKYTPMVSVLVEIGFICNPNIEANLRDVEVRQAIGETLGNALIEYAVQRGFVPAAMTE